MNIFKRMWASIKDKVRAALDRLPPIDEMIRERRVYARALVVLGDRVSAFEPDSVHLLEYVALAARIAQFASGGKLAGLEKLDLVLERVRAEWKRVGKADDQFDAWWAGLARPMLDGYAAEAKATDGWVKA